jgi:dynactin-4
VEEEPLRPGRTYTFELSFTNPLYDPIHVRLAVARPNATSKPPAILSEEAPEQQAPTPPPPPFAVNLPSPQFPISAYAEDWEYEDDEDAVLREDEERDEDGGAGGDGASPSKKKRRQPGIVERRMNRTTVAMDVAVQRDTVGPLRVRLTVFLPFLPFARHDS